MHTHVPLMVSSLGWPCRNNGVFVFMVLTTRVYPPAGVPIRSTGKAIFYYYLHLMLNTSNRFAVDWNRTEECQPQLPLITHLLRPDLTHSDRTHCVSGKMNSIGIPTRLWSSLEWTCSRRRRWWWWCGADGQSYSPHKRDRREFFNSNPMAFLVELGKCSGACLRTKD